MGQWVSQKSLLLTLTFSACRDPRPNSFRTKSRISRTNSTRTKQKLPDKISELLDDQLRELPDLVRELADQLRELQELTRGFPNLAGEFPNPARVFPDLAQFPDLAREMEVTPT